MKYVIAFLLLFSSTFAFAQDDDYSNADRLALSIPSAETVSTTAIANYINSHLIDENEKVRAAYIWVAANIRYSTDSLHRVILIEDHDQLIVHSLKRKKGVCENFAAILNDICKKCGLHSFVVEGYTKQNNIMDNTFHAWCTVYTNNAWHLYDPTWDEGVEKNNIIPISTNYFNMPPETFIASHMPFDPMFQLLEHPVSYKDFYRGSFSLNNDSPYFNYKDSIAAYEIQAPSDEYASSVARIQNNGKANKMTNTRVAQLKMEMEIINQDKDSVLYNNAVSDYNKAINIFNDFILYRNSQFNPLKPAAEVNAMFTEIGENIKNAYKNINGLKASKAVLTLDTGDIEYALKRLSNKAQEQNLFFKTFIASADKNAHGETSVR